MEIRAAHAVKVDSVVLPNTVNSAVNIAGGFSKLDVVFCVKCWFFWLAKHNFFTRLFVKILVTCLLSPRVFPRVSILKLNKVIETFIRPESG